MEGDVMPIDSVNHVREEYEAREAKQAKRHNDEVKQLQETNAETLRRLREGHEQQKKSVNERMRTTLNERDVKHNKDIEDLRRVYTNRLREFSEKSDQERRILEKNRDSELARTVERKDIQTEHLEEKLNNQIKAKDEYLRDYTARTRDDHMKDLKEQRAELTRSHESENENLRNELISDLGDARGALQKSEDIRSQESKRARAEAVARDRLREQQFSETLLKEREGFARVYDDQQQKSREGIDQTQAKYAQALKAAKERRDLGQESVDERNDGQVARMADRLRKQQDEANHREAKLRAQHGRSMNDVMRQNQEALQTAEELRRAQNEDVLQKANRDIQENRKQTDEQVSRTGRENLRQLREVTDKERNNRLSLIEDYETRLEQEKQVSELRQKKTIQNAQRELRVNSEYLEERLQQADENATTERDQLRSRSEQDRLEQLAQLRRRAMKNDQARNERMMVMEHKHAEERNTMIENNQRQLRRVHQFYQKQLDQKDKELRDKLESVRTFGESRLAEQADRFREETDRLRKQHEVEKLELVKKRNDVTKA